MVGKGEFGMTKARQERKLLDGCYECVYRTAGKGLYAADSAVRHEASVLHSNRGGDEHQPTV